MDNVKKIDKFFLFYEKHFNNLIVIAILTFSNIFYWLNKVKIGKGDLLTEYIATNILLPREGILITVAAILIGIYFTLFTILGTTKAESTLAILTKKKFFKVVTFIRNAFIFAILYLLFVIAFPILSKIFTGYLDHVLYLFLNILFVYMILSAVKVGLAFYVVFKNDLENLHEYINQERKEKQKEKVIFIKLENYLNEHQELKSYKKAIEINKIIKRKKPKK